MFPKNETNEIFYKSLWNEIEKKKEHYYAVLLYIVE
jgi:hypothetical protein